MSESAVPSEKTYNSVLIITSSAGGGLLQAANAKVQEIRRLYSSSKIIKKDILKEGIWSIGRFCANLWDKSQRRGNVKRLVWCLEMQKYAEYLFWPKIFSWVFHCLMKEKID